ncbi:hypothetical protein Tco_0429612 [Tanacetum coccineum]
MSSIRAWDETVNKLKMSLSSWKLKTLSIGGRLTLLKSVLGSTPIYNMSLFKVPKAVLKSMESIRRNFFNGIRDGEEKRLLGLAGLGLGVQKFVRWASKMSAPFVSSLRRDVRGGEESAQLSWISDLLDTVVLSNMGDRRFWDLNGGREGQADPHQGPRESRSFAVLLRLAKDIARSFVFGGAWFLETLLIRYRSWLSWFNVVKLQSSQKQVLEGGVLHFLVEVSGHIRKPSPLLDSIFEKMVFLKSLLGVLFLGIDIDPYPPGYFSTRLATLGEFFPDCLLKFSKDTEGNVVTMSEYLRFPFLDGATIEQGDVLSARDAITLHTTGPLPANQSLPEKTARLKEMEIPDPKIVAIRERKARAAAKKRAERKRAAGGEGGSKGKPKRRKVSVVRPEEEDSTEEASSASPLRTVAPNPSFLLRDVDEGTAESQEDEHVSVPNNDSANTNPDHTVEHDESFAANPEKIVAQDLVPLVRSNLAGDCADGAESSRPGSIYVPEWTIHWRSRVDTPGECRELLAHLAPPAVREEMNAYDNSTAMERAWFSIARGAMAQTDALLRFEALYDAHLVLKERCEDVTSKLVRGEHAGCAKKLTVVERERDELRAVNADQVSQIKELEAELARKDSALVFSDRVSNERAVENEKLVSRLGYFEKEKIDSIGKLLPTVVQRLLNSHEYKESLSVPFNLAIQAGWAKGLAVKRSEKDLMDVLREVQGFDPYSDTRMAVEYDKLFTKTYPFVEKISGLPRQTVQELLKMYPAPPPPDAPTRVNPPSQAPDGSKSVPEGANV